MNIDDVKVRLSNLDAGKVVKYDHAMNLATQFMLDYKNDVTYLLSIIEMQGKALNDAKEALDNQYRFNGGIIENNKAYMAIFNALTILK